MIENEDFVSNVEMVDLLSKSSPFYVNKKEKMPNKFSLVFAFLSKEEIKNNTQMFEKIDLLGDKEYYFEILDDVATLFAKVNEEGYVYITKDIKEEFNLKKDANFVFFELILFALVNFGVFWYLLMLVKENKTTITNIEKEFQELEEDAKKIAYEDTLTKACSRLKLNETLEDMIQIASKFKQNSFGLTMLDIDNFKKINDTYGHDYGDLVLKKVAQTVKNFLRNSDMFARWGGEEFIVVFPMTSLEQTAMIAEKLRVEIENIKFDKIDRVTCSFGVIVYENDTDVGSLIKRVDILLYRAKQNGRNRVEV